MIGRLPLTYGLMAAATKVSGARTKQTGRDARLGQMGANMSASGATVKCTDMVFTPGPMERGMKGITKTIISTDMAYSHGQMVKGTLVNGGTASSTAKDLCIRSMIPWEDVVTGSRGNEATGTKSQSPKSILQRLRLKQTCLPSSK